MIVIDQVTLRDEWNSYVAENKNASLYHLYDWRTIIERSFGKQTFYLSAKENGQTRGILPLCLINSRLFGRYMVSLPYLNYGGVLADSEEIERALIDQAIEISRKNRARHLELRYNAARPLTLPVKTSKVAMLLNLPESSEMLWTSFKSKLRSQVQRPVREGMEAVSGGVELLDSFYQVFSRNMRNLGTPIYGKAFFRNILTTLNDTAKITTVFSGEVPVASCLTMGFRKTMEIPWASSIREYNRFSPNMLLYWTVLKEACDQGYKTFDFGRSTQGQGTYRFKQQWGAEPVQLYWYYWLSQGSEIPELNPANPKYAMAIKVWQKLPLWVTKLVGPHLVKNLP